MFLQSLKIALSILQRPLACRKFQLSPHSVFSLPYYENHQINRINTSVKSNSLCLHQPLIPTHNAVRAGKGHNWDQNDSESPAVEDSQRIKCRLSEKFIKILNFANTQTYIKRQKHFYLARDDNSQTLIMSRKKKRSLSFGGVLICSKFRHICMLLSAKNKIFYLFFCYTSAIA